MAPGIALEALGGSTGTLKILDPMVGSGTVLAVARAKGHEAFGFDLDPLAVLLTTVWTRTINADQITRKAIEVLSRARVTFRALKSKDAYPLGSDDETQKFVRYWFDDYSRRQLTSLSLAISRVRDAKTRDVLWCGFSRLIISKQSGASLAMDLSHSRPHKAFEKAPIKPLERFIAAVATVVENCPRSDEGADGPTTQVAQGDARCMQIAKGSIDLVLTSPPYLNAIDYMRCSKFSLVWMGYTIRKLREIRGESVGTEIVSQEAKEAEWVKTLIKKLRLRPALPVRSHALLSQYVWDMGRALTEVSRVLKPGGKAVYVVGDSTINGTFVRNSSIIAATARSQGLSLTSRQARALPENRRYMPPPQKDGGGTSMNGRMRREVVLVFEKRALALPIALQ